ncbi:MAG: hypothetical protein I3274_06815 [Candidatus Moeniiplasma glomeromycotorum]|nr:hypothetical protein [Candidatus Moeniiplasma glomeromycotorum]MCE8167306.1 hypothetical protein [Candidatus Moeniiplasma glomeromycotorum]
MVILKGFKNLLGANLTNWTILVVGGKESKCDSLSSGERKGSSLNQQGVTKVSHRRISWKTKPEKVKVLYSKWLTLLV